MSGPKVSILIPCHNAETWIRECIQSALDQTYPHKEILVVDDGSTDQSLSIIQSFGNLITCQTQANLGANIARNRLLEMSTGDWLQYLDADDYLKPAKIADQIGFLHEAKDADIIYSPVIREQIHSGHSEQSLLAMPSQDNFLLNFVRWGSLQTTGLLWKRSALKAVGGWTPDQPVCQEHELMLRLIKHGSKFRFFSKAGSIYRRTGIATLHTQNKELSIRIRLEIIQKLAVFLKEQGLMSAELEDAVYLSRFDCALHLKNEHPQFAEKIFAQVNAYNPGNPWALLSVQKTAERHLAPGSYGPLHEKRIVFDWLYKQTIQCYRTGKKKYAANALMLWKRSGLTPPYWEPQYQRWLHRVFGFYLAEWILVLIDQHKPVF